MPFTKQARRSTWTEIGVAGDCTHHITSLWRRGVFCILGVTAVVFGVLLWSRWSWRVQPYLFRVSKPISASEFGNQEDIPGTIKWWPCGQGHAPGAECGYVMQVRLQRVPLDYFNAAAGVAKVALGRYKASTNPRKGMVLFNPGGPGGPGKPVATQLGPYFQSLIGTDYDFVGFDPRGIGESEPRVQCFRAPGNYYSFKAHTILDQGFDVGPNLSDSRTRDHLILQQEEAESLYKTQFELCGRTMGDALRYMGTSTVSRDIDFITTALEGKDALMRVQAQLAGERIAHLIDLATSMVRVTAQLSIHTELCLRFPNRVGRVIIDGIVDPVAWSTVPSFKWYKSWLGDAEEAYRMFLKGCSEAGPSVCALAKNKDENPSNIEERIEQFFAKIYIKPLAVPSAVMPGILTAGRTRIALYVSLAQPRAWPTLAHALSEAIQGDGTSLLDLAQSNSTSDLERSAVSCNDMAVFSGPTPEEVIDESLDVLNTVTRFALSVAISEPDSGCQFWPVTPPEKFQGPWNHTLNNPILIHSNLADPATPLSNGRLVKQLLGASASLAIREGPAKITQAYFENGTLPPNEYICPVDESPFQDAITLEPGQNANLMEHLQIIGQALDRMARGLPLLS
ncbi:hypothetical protein K439DRAFT_1620181 [Ramaria rubella]|nr:hypothetical protein K439DRAFT_1620181 [Ramaria rubella]